MSDILDGRSILAAAPLVTWADVELRLPLAVLPCGHVPHLVHPYLSYSEEP